MKLCIVIQSEAFRSSAGMRIRYERFAECLEDSGIAIEALTCDDLLNAQQFDQDVYIFCKCFDASALLLARRIRRAGKIVGQDFFDDYFSQHFDLRLQRFRNWMRDMAALTDYAVCSTPRMALVLEPYLGTMPLTVIDDPIIGLDPLRIGSLADAKIARACAERHLKLVWFGIGDNPFFPVGIKDLASIEWALAILERGGWQLSLQVVTNKRPFEGDGARRLRALGIGFDLVEWTEKAEAKALNEATVALLPVDGQSFSTAKSLNRAVTALSSGCQVLSPGYPLYDRLGEFVYQNPEDLVSDLAAGTCRLQSSQVSVLISRLSELANPFKAATDFAGAARKALQAPRQPLAKELVCLVHGRSSAIDQHKAVGRLGGLSIRSPFSNANWNFHLRFDQVGAQLRFRIRKDVRARFPMMVIAPGKLIRILDHDFEEVDIRKLGVEPLILPAGQNGSAALDLVRYGPVMSYIETCCTQAFGPVDVLVADGSALGIHGRNSISLVEVAPAALGIPSVEHSIGHRQSSLKESIQGARKWLKRRVLKRSNACETLSTIRSSDLFDEDWYRARYPDVSAAGSGMDAAEHYHRFGWREGRDPGPAFSTKAYLRDHPDVAGQDSDPLLHYLEHGEAEGRQIRPSAFRR